MSILGLIGQKDRDGQYRGGETVKRVGLISVVFLLIAALTLPALAAQRTLAVGSRGDDVAELQATLSRLGLSPGPIDGVFGSQTLQAVTKLQAKYGLTVDGIVGPATYGALDRSIEDPSRSGASYERYIVQPGDTLYLVARRFGISLEEVSRANALPSPDWIYPGQALAIPRSFPAAPPVTPSPTPPPAPTGKFDVVGYYVKYYDGDNLSWNSYSAYQDTISTVAAFSYQINWDGSVSGEAYNDLLGAAGKAGKPVLALVHNIGASGGFDRDLIHAILTNVSLRQTAVRNIARVVRNNGYAGVNVDFEDIATYDRDAYTAFVRELAADLHSDGYQVTLSVPAKTWDDPNNAWAGAFDYQALGKVADAIMIMTYDEHWSGGAAGPVASLGWVKQVIEYAAAVMPPQKIRMGIAAYGYDWPAGGYGGKAVTAREAESLASRYGAKVQWDSKSQSPYFMYWPGNSGREVWFENTSSIAAKIDLALQYKIGGIAIWRLGFEDPAMWKMIADKI